MGLSNNSCEAGSFSLCHLNPHRCFQSEVCSFISPCWSPGLRSLLCSPAIPPGLSMCECGAAGSASCRIACPVHSTIRHISGSHSQVVTSSLHPSCPSPPLLLVWINVSSLSPWLSDFRVVQFFCQFWLFFIFKLLLSFFRLCEEAQCIYLRHLGQKPGNALLGKLAK